MTSAQVDVLLVAVVVAAACAIPGTFLVLRRMAMMSDAISHTVLLGIVLAFFVVADLNSPVLILGAALVGLFTVVLVEVVSRTGLVREDTAIGLVFPRPLFYRRHSDLQPRRQRPPGQRRCAAW